MSKKPVFTVCLLFLVLFAFLLLPDREITLLVFAIGFTSATYFLALALWLSKKGRQMTRRMSRIVALFSMIFVVLPFMLGVAVIFLCPFNLSSILFSIMTVGFAITLSFDFLNIPLALYHKRLEEGIEKQPLRDYPLISIIVPAHNEEKCIEGTLETLLEIDYPRKEIIVVDDGSTDRTYEIATRYIPKGVKIIRRIQGGKWAALNYGLLFSKGEIIVTIDADSLISRTALKEMAKRFQDPKIMAECGNVKVLNRNNFLTKCQAYEYITDINIVKSAFDFVGSVMIVPGALGAFRREALVSTGKYDPDTVTEDFDTTLKALKIGGVIQICKHAYAYTEAPETFRDFYKQRLRWYRGSIQVLTKHKDVVLNPIYGFLSFIGYPYILLSMFVIPLCGLVALASGVIACLTGYALEFFQRLSLFISLEFLYALLAIQLDEEDAKLTLYSPFFVIGYRHLRDIIRMKALIDVIIMKKRAEWGRVERKGRWRRSIQTPSP
jgi:cellulose synthase/poly-beta-1,6-N-acetylglucosamine synthase-like glycosyltransferase